MEEEGILEHVRANEAGFRERIEGSAGHPDRRRRARRRLLPRPRTRRRPRDRGALHQGAGRGRPPRDPLARASSRQDSICRADDRGDPVVQLSPPLIAGEQQFDEIESILRTLPHRRLRGLTGTQPRRAMTNRRRRAMVVIVIVGIPRGQGGRAPGRDHARRGARARRPRASPCSSRPTPAPTRPSATTSTAPRAPRSWPTRRDVWDRSGMVLKVKEPQDSEFGCLRPDLVLFTYLHLAAYPQVADGTARPRHDRDRLRDRAGQRRAAAARADERGRGADGHPGRRAVPRTRARWPGGAARRRARRPAGTRRRARRRQRRLEQRVDRPGHGGRGPAARQEPRSAPLGRPDPPGSDRDAGVATAARSPGPWPTPISSSAPCWSPPGGHRSWSPRTWCAAMKPGAVIVDVAVDQGGCIETTHETTHAAPGVRTARRPALRRRQHAGRGAVHLDLRPHQRHPAVRAPARDARRRRRRRRRSGARPRRQHRRRARDPSDRGRGARPPGRVARRRRSRPERRRAPAAHVARATSTSSRKTFDVTRRVDTEPDLVAAHLQHGHRDVVADHDLFVDPTRQHQHDGLRIRGAGS